MSGWLRLWIICAVLLAIGGTWRAMQRPDVTGARQISSSCIGQTVTSSEAQLVTGYAAPRTSSDVRSELASATDYVEKAQLQAELGSIRARETNGVTDWAELRQPQTTSIQVYSCVTYRALLWGAARGFAVALAILALLNAFFWVIAGFRKKNNAQTH